MDKISVRIPASPAYLQVVRLVASGLASRLGFTIDEIEDLKIGVDELSAYMTGAQGRDGDLSITFSIEDNCIEIQGTGTFGPGQKVRTELTDFSKMILATVVDGAALTEVDGRPSFVLSKRKTA